MGWLPISNPTRKEFVPKYPQTDVSFISSHPKKGEEVTVKHGGREITGRVISYFLDENQEEHVLVDLERIMIIRRSSEIV